MKKHTTLFALGILLCAQFLPVAAHANTIKSTTDSHLNDSNLSDGTETDLNLSEGTTSDASSDKSTSTFFDPTPEDDPEPGGVGGGTNATPNSNPITINYFDMNGKSIKSTETSIGYIGQPYSFEAPEIDGYTLSHTDGNSTGEYSDTNSTVSFYYSENEAKTSTFTIYHWDVGMNNKLAPDEVITGKVGDTIEIKAKYIYGYYYNPDVSEDQVIGTHTFTEEDDWQHLFYTRRAGGIIVSHVDIDTGLDIAQGVTVGEYVGTEYSFEPKEIEGYTYVGTRDDYPTSGYYPEGTDNLDFLYSKNKSPIVVNYIDEDGLELFPSETYDVTYGEPLNLKSVVYEKSIYGKSISNSDDSLIIHYSENEQIVNVVFTNDEAQPLVVKYLDEQGNSIDEDMIVTGNVGDEYALMEIRFDGYTLSHIEGSLVGELNTEQQFTTFHYTRDTKSIYVKYVDEDGNEMFPSEEITGAYGDSYTITPEEVYGYSYGVFGSLTGTITDEEQFVTVEYSRDSGGTVMVEYVDIDGNWIADMEIINGDVNDNYSTREKEIEGYTLVRVDGEASGKIDYHSQMVSYVYEKSEGGSITINYIDENGVELFPTETLTGKFNDEYSITPKEKYGYTLNNTSGNLDGQFTMESQTITFNYTRDISADVVVSYLDEAGNKISEDTILNGYIGDEYTVNAKSIEGYSLITTPDNTSGTFGYDSEVIEFVYKADANDENKPVRPTDPEDGSSGGDDNTTDNDNGSNDNSVDSNNSNSGNSSLTDATNNNSETNDKSSAIVTSVTDSGEMNDIKSGSSLPSTGDISKSVIAPGMALIGLAAFLLFKRKSKGNKNS